MGVFAPVFCLLEESLAPKVDPAPLRLAWQHGCSHMPITREFDCALATEPVSSPEEQIAPKGKLMTI